MSKNNLQLKSAILNLNINKPYDLRAQIKPTLKAPAQKKQPETEHTQIEDAQSKQSGNGFFMLAHSVFKNERLREISGDAFRIFVWMSSHAWRFQDSMGEIRASVDYVAAGCGCSRSTATRSLQDLKTKNFIECIEQNYKKGNLWKISRIADGRLMSEQVQIENASFGSAQIEAAQSKQEGCSNSVSSVLNLNMEHAQNEHELISINNSNNQKPSLSEPDVLEKYIQNILAPKKRESEEQALSELLKSIPRESVLTAFRYLESRKFKFKETLVHSPMQFLTYAMGEVLPSAETAVKSVQATSLARMEAKGVPQSDILDFNRERQEMWESFRTAFITMEEQELEISKHLKGLPFPASAEFARDLAVTKWWEAKSQR